MIGDGSISKRKAKSIMTMNEREYLLKNTYLEIFEFRICNSLAPSKCIFKGWNFKWIKLFAQSDVEKEILFPKRMNSIMYYTMIRYKCPKNGDKTEK